MKGQIENSARKCATTSGGPMNAMFSNRQSWNRTFRSPTTPWTLLPWGTSMKSESGSPAKLPLTNLTFSMSASTAGPRMSARSKSRSSMYPRASITSEARLTISLGCPGGRCPGRPVGMRHSLLRRHWHGSLMGHPTCELRQDRQIRMERDPHVLALSATSRESAAGDRAPSRRCGSDVVGNLVTACALREREHSRIAFARQPDRARRSSVRDGRKAYDPATVRS
jgi:hypothetical protein